MAFECGLRKKMKKIASERERGKKAGTDLFRECKFW